MSDSQIVEQIWVSVAEGAEKTGFHPDHVRRLARENWRLPEAERTIRVHKPSNEYAIWLPDLIDHTNRHNPFANRSNAQAETEMWVTTTEASAMTGYHQVYLQQLANKNWKLPPEERTIKLRNRSNRYEFWLPDLIAYSNRTRRGPHPK